MTVPVSPADSGGCPAWVTRFAPSPTGFLHLGHVASAVLNARAARDSGGMFLLRMEDIDRQRCTGAFADAIAEDLRWLGLRWHGEPRCQSAHFDDYRLVLEALSARGLLYPCFCTRAEILRESAEALGAPHAAPDGSIRYPGTCRRLSLAERVRREAAGQPYTLRLDMAAALAEVEAGSLRYRTPAGATVGCRPDAFGDVVLARRDVPASYHLCVTHDDVLQGVTLVIRGEDLRAATDVHRLLQALMGWPTPVYHHHPLLVGADGRRLAKRDKAATIRDMRMAGATPDAVLARALAGMAVPPGAVGG